MAHSAAWPAGTDPAGTDTPSPSCASNDDAEATALSTQPARPVVAKAGHRTVSGIPLVALAATPVGDENNAASRASVGNENAASAIAHTGNGCVVQTADPADDESDATTMARNTAHPAERLRTSDRRTDDVRPDGVRTEDGRAGDDDRRAAGSGRQTPQQSAFVSAASVK